MGIYIAGIDMPHDGEFKHIRIYDNGDVTVEFSDGEDVIAHASPVPPHGRLIDASEITEHKYTTIPSHRKKYADGKPKSDEEIIAFKFGWNYAIDGIVENAPTIIPASDKDTNVLGKEEEEDG